MTPQELRAFRARHGYTQSKLATLLSFDGPSGVRNVLRWENGHNETPAPVARIVRAIERDPRVRLVFEAMAS